MIQPKQDIANINNNDTDWICNTSKNPASDLRTEKSVKKKKGERKKRKQKKKKTRYENQAAQLHPAFDPSPFLSFS